MRETDADRSWQAGHGKSWTSMRIFFQTRCTRRIQRKVFLIDYRPSQLISSRTWSICARTFLWKSEPRFGRRRFKSGDTKMEAQVFMLTSANTKRDLFCERKRVVTWKQLSTKVNLGTMTSPLSWYKISPFSGYYPCENRTSQETEKKFVEIFRAVTEAKCCWYERLIRIRQFLWRIVMESSDNYTLLLRNERNCRTSCTSSKQKASAVLLHSGLNEKCGGQILWNAFTICRMSKNLLTNGKS